MIEAATHSPLETALRRSLVAGERPMPRESRSSLAADLRFFATAYAGALAFFLTWLA